MGLIELTGFGDLLRMIGVLFWGLTIGALVMALTLPKTWRGKATATLIVVGLFVAFPGRWAWEAKQQRDAARARYPEDDGFSGNDRIRGLAGNDDMDSENARRPAA